VTSEFEAASNEQDGGRPSMTIAGRKVEFPAVLPPGIAAAVQKGRADWIYEILSGGDEELEHFLVLHLSNEHFDEVAALYGLNAPESPASAGS
jgi:hypothetical protein